MPWFRVDDGLAFHQKVVAAGNAAMGLWVRAGAWCSQQLTDGHVPAHMIAMLGRASEAQRLVEAGLWEEVEDGFRFWQWQDRNPCRADVEQERSDARERMRKVRTSKRSGERSPERSPEQPPNVRPNVRANDGRSSGAVTPTPTRPDPTPRSPNVLTPAEPAAVESTGQRANRLATAYTDRVPLSAFLAVQGVVQKAIKAGYDDTVIAAALDRIADDGRSLTAETLRIEIQGPARRRVSDGRVSTDDVSGYLDGPFGRSAS